MRIHMELLSDCIFGNGQSIPGEEDISVLCDEYGFPYYKGGTFKGVFREELENYLEWQPKRDAAEREKIVDSLLGKSGDDDADCKRKIQFSDFKVSDAVKNVVLAEISGDAEAVKNAFTDMRTFTAIDDKGMVQEGSLRRARCVNQGLIFYSDIECEKDDEELVKEVLSLIKWIGTMRNRGFGKVKIRVV